MLALPAKGYRKAYDLAARDPSWGEESLVSLILGIGCYKVEKKRERETDGQRWRPPIVLEILLWHVHFDAS